MVEWSLQDLQEKQLPRADWRTIFTITGDLDCFDIAEMDWYFRHFLQPTGGCINCGEHTTGLEAFLLGRPSFTWGLVHGEGYCFDCRYPARAYHRKIGPIGFVELVLQYHPDELKA